MKQAVVILAAVVAALQFAVADDFKTINGKEYKDATVSRVEADGIVLKTKWGISKVYFVELSREVQERFHYNAAIASVYSAQEAVKRATTAFAGRGEAGAVISQKNPAAPFILMSKRLSSIKMSSRKLSAIAAVLITIADFCTVYKFHILQVL